MVQVVVGERADADEEQVVSRSEHRLAMLAHCILPCKLDHQVERLGEKTLAIGRDEGVGRWMLGLPADQDRRQGGDIVLAGLQSCKKLMGSRPVADEAES
jgi:hypothetical protein